MSGLTERLASLSSRQRELLSVYLAEQGVDLGKLRITPRADPAAPCPLSYAQQRLWFLTRLEPESVAYNLPFGVLIRGPLEVAAMAASLAEVVRRHEALRTVFLETPAGPLQAVRPGLAPGLPVVDLGGLPESRRRARLDRLGEAVACRPFDLDKGPLLRAVLVRLRPRETALLAAMHHLVSDGWSMGVLIRELGALYEAFAARRPSPLPALPVQYADYALWQHGWLAGATLAGQLSYWRRQLAGAPALLDLPGDRPRPKEQGSRGGAEKLVLDPALGGSLAALGRTAGATLFMVLLAGWNALLARYSGQRDILVGVPIANRSRDEVEGLIGFFVNTLVLRTDLAGDPPFLELLRRVREAAIDAQAHQDLPFEKLVEELAPARSLAHTPLFQVMFVLQNAPLAPLAVAGLTLEPLQLASGTAKFDLDLNLLETPAGLVGTLEYSRELFDAATARRLAGHFSALLAGAVLEPGASFWDLPMLPASERHQVIFEWGDGAVAAPGPRCFHELFAAQARLTPDAIAAASPAACLSYRQLDADANRLARWLAGRGVGPEVLVALLADRGLDLLTAILAIWKAGGAYLPLDPRQPAPRQRQILRQSRAELVLAGSGFVTDLAEVLSETVPAERPRVLLLERHRGPPRSGEGLGRHAEPGDLAYVIFTSGSTGTPKGAMVEQRGMLNHMLGKTVDLELTARDVVAQNAALSFDVSVWQLFTALLVGGRVQILPDPIAHEPLRLIGAVETSGITILEIVPSLLHALLDELGERREAPPRLAGLRWLISTGEALSPGLCRAWLSLYPAVPLLNAYGPTECSDDVSSHPVRAAPAPAAAPGAVPIGRPVLNLQLYVLGPGLQPQPAGVPGEVYVGGAGLGRGYLHDGGRTAESWVPSPFGRGEPGARLYRTGDRGRLLADGTIEFRGRVDHQVKVRGQRIELGEIEAVLAGHPAVRQAVVLVHETASGNGQLVAYAVVGPRPAAPADRTGGAGEALIAALAALAAERLPEAMVPASFVLLDSLPLTPNGKLDRKALPAPARPAPRARVAARTPLERLLAGIWADLLGLETIGIGDNFFASGGHSLLATRVVSRIREACGVELPLRSLFESPTIEELAACIERAKRSGAALAAPPIRRIARGGSLPLSFAQQRLWLIHQLEPGDPSYNIPLPVWIDGRLDVAFLRLCLAELVRRHETLRTRFLEVDGEPGQRIDPAGPASLPVVDLGGLTAAAQQAEARRLQREESWRPFDLAGDELLRATLVRLAPARWLALFTMHHIVSDGWSMGVLVGEVSVLYGALAAGRPPRLPELSIQYADYAQWQREWLSGEVLESEMAYWREQLAGAPPRLELPLDRPRTASQTRRGAVRSTALEPLLLGALEALGREQSATLFMTLLAAFLALLSRYSGQRDIVVGTPIAGRGQLQTENLIGLFLNTLALRGDLSGEPSFRELLGRVRGMALGAYAHQDLPFEKLVWDLAPERSLAHTPLFQVLFVQNAPAQALTLPGLTFRPFDVAGAAAKFDLTLTLAESGGGGLTASLVYKRELFDGATAARMARHFEILLAAACADASRRFTELPLLDAGERAQLLREWNDTWTAPAAAGGIVELVALHAAATPAAAALVCEDRTVTYGELWGGANRLARRLRRLGVGPETLVGIYCQRSPAAVVGMLAALTAQGAYLPLDPGLPGERLAWILAASRPVVVLTQLRWRDRLPGDVRALCLDDEANGVDAESAAGLALPSAPESLAYVIYTSGSTGSPKGVAVERRQLIHYTSGVLERLELAANRSFAVVSTLAADLGHTVVFPALASGGCLHLMTEERAQDGEAFAAYLDERGIDCLKIVPSHLKALHAVERPERAMPRRQLVLGGEASSWNEIERLQGLAPRCRIFNHYGPTEATVGVLTLPVRVDVQPRQAATLPLGRPLPGAEIHLLDAGGQPVPIGVWGELHIGGRGLARGYLERPDLTAERFIPDPVGGCPGRRLYRSGDLARRLADGTVEFLGRVDQQVKIRGYRIEPREIEAALESHPGVAEAAVVALQDAAGDQVLVAYLAPRREPHLAATAGGITAAPADGELRGYLEARLPAYMMPADLVWLASLPRSPNGKIDRRALPAPARRRLEPAAGAAPRTPTEEVLAALWAEALTLNAVAVDADFFALGGQSLIAMRLISRVRRAFAVELPLRTFFERPTIEGLARAIEELQRAARGLIAPPIEPVSRRQELPLSFAQQRLWFMQQLDPASPAYNIPASLEVEGKLSLPALAASFRELRRRHEVLRTRFLALDGRAVQVIDPPALWALPLVDLQGLPPAGQAAEGRRLDAEEARRPFDLARGPLVRVAVVRRSELRHVLLLTVHHAISDGWSMGILLRELAALYGAAAEGRPSPLRELGIQYADYACWQRGRLAGEPLAAHLAYWREQLAGVAPRLELPTDRPRPAEQSFNGGRRLRRMPASLTEALRALSRRQGTTQFMTLLAAFQALLAGWSGRDDILVGTPISGRDQTELEGLIGCFVNLLPLRADLSGDPTFLDLLDRVRRSSLDAHIHQNLPFELLVEQLRPQRDLSHHPVVQVTFAFQEQRSEILLAAGLTVSSVGFEESTAQFDLALNMGESAGELIASLSYSADLFDPATVDRVLSGFEALLVAIAQRPESRVSALRQAVIATDLARRGASERDFRDARGQIFAKLRRRAGQPAIADSEPDSEPDPSPRPGLEPSLQEDELDRLTPRLS